MERLETLDIFNEVDDDDDDDNDGGDPVPSVPKPTMTATYQPTNLD